MTVESSRAVPQPLPSAIVKTKSVKPRPRGTNATFDPKAHAGATALRSVRSIAQAMAGPSAPCLFN